LAPMSFPLFQGMRARDAPLSFMVVSSPFANEEAQATIRMMAAADAGRFRVPSPTSSMQQLL
jgi:hypothetical protein